MESVSLCTRMKLTAFVQLESTMFPLEKVGKHFLVQAPKPNVFQGFTSTVQCGHFITEIAPS